MTNREDPIRDNGPHILPETWDEYLSQGDEYGYSPEEFFELPLETQKRILDASEQDAAHKFAAQNYYASKNANAEITQKQTVFRQLLRKLWDGIETEKMYATLLTNANDPLRIGFYFTPLPCPLLCTERYSDWYWEYCGG